MASACAPSLSTMWPTSRATMVSSSQPVRILAVTGVPGTARTTAPTTLPILAGLRSIEEPASIQITRSAGQPKLISIKSGCRRSASSRAASAIESGLAPKICTPIGRCCSVKSTVSHSLGSSRMSASDCTNSVTMTSAPCSLQNCRKTMSVTRAIGAR